MIRTNYKKMPLEAIWLGMEVARFYEVCRDLGLVQPDTGLNFQDYSLVIFHADLEVTDESGKAPVPKGASVYASIKTEKFKQYLVGEDGKTKRDAVLPLEELHQFVAIYDEHLPGGIGNGDFLSPDNLTKERDIKYSRKIHGVQFVQRYVYKQRIACDFAYRILRSIFKLDFPTDESAAEDARGVLDAIMKKKD